MTTWARLLTISSPSLHLSINNTHVTIHLNVIIVDWKHSSRLRQLAPSDPIVQSDHIYPVRCVVTFFGAHLTPDWTSAGPADLTPLWQWVGPGFPGRSLEWLSGRCQSALPSSSGQPSPGEGWGEEGGDDDDDDDDDDYHYYDYDNDDDAIKMPDGWMAASTLPKHPSRRCQCFCITCFSQNADLGFITAPRN